MKSRYNTIIALFFSCFFLPSFNTNAQPATPTGLVANSYDSHIELEWDQNAEPNLSGYRIYRSENNGSFYFLEFTTQLNTAYIDFIGEHDQNFNYKISARNTSGQESSLTDAVQGGTFEMTDEELLTMVQEYTFRYFWDFAHPVSGLARERNSTSTVTTGGSGFGVMGILVGIERGFITYEQGVERLLKIVNFLENADRFHGVFPHWMNGATGETINFSQFDDGGDLVETAFLIQGLLTVRECINGDTSDEIALRNKITQIWETVDWNWYRKSVQQVLFWHWSENFGWQLNHQIRGFNEAHIVYILAIASPTHPVPASLYHNGWAGGNYENGASYYGFPLDVGSFRGGPLFFAHYSYMGFDPRYKKDQYTNYFNRNVYHTLINQAYCIENPENHLGYSEVCWGLTASDDPWGYLAHEPTMNRDNGTISPTAAISSMPYTPGISKDAMKHFYRDHGERLWGKYGFYDAFNLDEDWFADSYLAIDQGPILGMIENYRTGLLWDCFMSNPEIQTALDAIGFETDSTLVTSTEEVFFESDFNFEVFPNPARDFLNIQIQMLSESVTLQNTTLELIDLNGRVLETVFINQNLPQGMYEYYFDINDLPNGAYLLKLKTQESIFVEKVLIFK